MPAARDNPTPQGNVDFENGHAGGDNGQLAIKSNNEAGRAGAEKAMAAGALPDADKLLQCLSKPGDSRTVTFASDGKVCIAQPSAI